MVGCCDQHVEPELQDVDSHVQRHDQKLPEQKIYSAANFDYSKHKERQHLKPLNQRMLRAHRQVRATHADQRTAHEGGNNSRR